MRQSPEKPGPVFLHSSWRTSSTWLWERFRALPDTMCFYEPFHEVLPRISLKAARDFGADSWESGHGDSAPYFFEYIPLLRKAGGVRLHQPAFSYDWFIPEGGLGGAMRSVERRYVALLSRTACKAGKVPVLGFTRSLGRITPLKRQFGACNIFLFRNLWGQWMSVLDQRRKGGDSVFFYNILRVVADQPQDRYLTDIHNYYLRRSIDYAARLGVMAQIGALPAGQLTQILFDVLPEGEMFELFMAIHLYLYMHAFLTADITLDSTEMARNREYRAERQSAIREATGLAVDFFDAKQGSLKIEMIGGPVNWGRIAQHARLAVSHLQSHHDRASLETLADQMIGAAIEESQAP